MWNHHGWVKNQRIAPCKVIRISEWEKFFYFWNPELRSGNLESCYCSLESRIHVPLLRNPKSSSWIPESTEWNPGSKTYMGRKEEISIMDVQYQICRLAWRLLVKVIFRQDRIKLPAWHSPPFLLIVSSSVPPRPHPQSLGRSVNYLLTKLEKVNHIGPYPTRENILYQWCMCIKRIKANKALNECLTWAC